MQWHLRSLYLCVYDMERAIRFYENLLDMPVSEKDELYSVFDIQGFRLGLFCFEKVLEKHTFGSNCLPSFEVDSLVVLKEKIKNQNVCFPLTRIKNRMVVEIVDSEGNHIEMTAPLQGEHL